MPPPVWLAAAAGTQLIVAGRRRTTRGSRAAALAIAAGSIALMAASVATLRAHGTTLDPEHPDRTTALVTDGPFARTRNPVYLALAGLLTAHAVARRSVPAVAAAAGFVLVVDRTQVPREEDALRRRFGKAYDRYRRSVPRWIGAPQS